MRGRGNEAGAGSSRVARAAWSRRGSALGVALAGVLLLSSGGAKWKDTTVDPFTTLKPGHWVRMEGPMQPDSIAGCDELRLLTGDFLDDDWSLRGLVQATDTTKNFLVIAGVRVDVMENTGYDSPIETFRGLPDVRPGMLVEVEGSYQKSRRINAHEVDDESDETGRKPWSANRIRIVARVERIDARKRLITAMGFVFHLTDKTRVRSVIE